jgi:hypothetical protein
MSFDDCLVITTDPEYSLIGTIQIFNRKFLCYLSVNVCRFDASRPPGKALSGSKH